VRWFVCGLALLLLACPTHAADQRALLTLTVNASAVGEVPVLLRDDDLYVRVRDLEETTRLRLPLGSRTELLGDTYVLLGSLAPEVTYVFSEEKLRVDVTAPPTLFGTTTAQLATKKPEGFRISTDTSAYLNYAVESLDFGLPSGAVETGVSVEGTYLFLASASRSDRLGFTRGPTSVSIEDHERLTRLTIGDGLAATTSLGASGVFAGLTYRREFVQDPYFMHRPDQLLTGLATTPSIAKIYVNGVFLKQTALPPGPFELHNLTIPSGARNVEVVVTDAFGRETRTRTAAYVVPALLKPGMHDYSYTLGLPRLSTDPRHPLGQYGKPAFVGADRYGLTDHLTLGGRFEVGPTFVSLGPGLTVGSKVGQFDLDTALSWERQPGGAISASYNYSAFRSSFGILARLMTPRYATAVQPASMDRTTLEIQPYASYQLTSSWTIGLSATHSRTRDKGGMHAVHVGTGVELTQNLGLLLDADYIRVSTGQKTFQATLSLNYSFGGGNTARVEARQDKTGGSTSMMVDRSLPVGDGFGYRITGNYGATTTGGAGLLQVQGPYGRFEGEVTGDPETTTGRVRHRLNYAGGIAMVNGTVKAGRPVDEAFGIIKVADLPNVRVKVENGLIGKTGSDGTLLLPNLLPYYGNRVDVVTEDIPVDRAIEVLTRLAVPPLRSGTFLDFRAPKVFGINGTIRPQVPDLPLEFGPGSLTLTVTGETQDAVVGRHGEFYLENLAAGTYEARVEFPNITCRALLQIPATDESFASLGEVPCRPE
jgi:outer membrane usher protein